MIHGVGRDANRIAALATNALAKQAA